MIVHAVELESFGRFLAPVRIELDERRVNVLAGPNGAGKSTLLAGLARAFVYSYKSSAVEVVSVQPWGRQLGPRVAVEFSQGGERYRLEKKFLKGRGAWLWQWRDGGYVMVCEDEAVEMRLPEFLGGEATAGRNASAKSFLTASVLWSAQGEMELGAVEGPVLERVRQSLGAQAESGLTALVEREAARRFAEDWQPARGAWKKGSAAAVAQERWEAARAECARWERALADLDALRDEVAGLELQAEAAREFLAGMEPELVAVEGRLAEWRTKSARREAVRLEWEAKQSAYQLEKARRERRAGLAAEVGDLEGRLAKGVAELEAARGQVGAAEAAVYRRLMEARGVEGEARAREARLAELAAPDGALLGRLERLEMQLEASLIHLDFEVESGRQVRILSGEPEGLLELRAGEAARVSGSPEIRVELPGFGRIRASGPAESAANLRAQLKAERGKLRSADAGAGLAALRERRTMADELERELAGLRERLVKLMREQSWRDLEVLQAAHPEWSGAALPEVGGEVGSVGAARATLAGLERTQKERQAGLDKARRELVELPAAGAEVDLDGLALEVHGLKMQLREIEAELQEYPRDLEQRAVVCRERVEGARRKRAEAEGGGLQRRAVLRDRLGDAPYEAYAQAKARAAECEEAARVASAQARAGKLLLETLRAVKGESSEQYVEPVAAAVNGLMARVAGVAPGVVRLSRGLAPRDLVAAGVEVGLSQVSGGEFEQIHFAARLALADLLSVEERQLVVFDDVLMATDGQRMGRILELLEERRERLQVLILTCHPERYVELGDRNLIEMPRRGAASA